MEMASKHHPHSFPRASSTVALLRHVLNSYLERLCGSHRVKLMCCEQCTRCVLVHSIWHPMPIKAENFDKSMLEECLDDYVIMLQQVAGAQSRCDGRTMDCSIIPSHEIRCFKGGPNNSVPCPRSRDLAAPAP